MRTSPLAQNFFIFMQFSGKIDQIIGWHPPFGVSAPPLGNPGSATDDVILDVHYDVASCCVHDATFIFSIIITM